MTPAEELRDLFERVAEMALSNAEKYGHFIPLCVANDHAGQRYIFASDSFDDPPAPYDPKKSFESVEHQVRKWVAEGKLRALALARNLDITFDGADGKPQTSAAMKVALDHVEG